MKLKLVIQSILIFLTLLVLLSPVFVGNQGDFILTLMSVIYFVTLLFVLEIKLGETTPLLYVFVIYSITSMGLRLCQLNYNIDSIRFGELVNIEGSDLVFTIFMLWLSTLFLIAGLILGCYFKGGNSVIRKLWQFTCSYPVPSEPFLFWYSFMLIPLSWVLALWVNNYSANYWVNIASILLGYFAVFYLFLGYCVIHWDRFSSKKRKLIFLYAGLFLVMRILVGSKGGIYQLAMGILMATVVLKPNCIISLRLLLSAFFFIPAAVIFYFSGQEVRYLLQTFVDNDISLVAYLSVFNSVLSNISIENFVDYANKIIVQSFAMLDYLNVLYNHEPVNDYLGFGYTFKALWNAVVPHYLLPSLYFDEASLLPARLFRLAYGQGSYDDLINHYHTDFLPLFGTLFVSMGYFSLPILMLLGLVTSYMYKQFPSNNINYLFFYKIVFVYCFISSLFAMGIATMFVEFIQCFLLPAVLFFLSQWLLKCRVFKNVNLSIAPS